MIKINLLAERKQTQKTPSAVTTSEGALGGGQNLLLVGILLLGAIVTGGWWWTLKGRTADLNQAHVEADQELERLTEIRKKGEEYKKKKEMLIRQIDLITKLKKQQEVPVHILDQISKNLPEFSWLTSMTVNNNNININGQATTYNTVTTFYNNLKDSGYFTSVTLGRTFEVKDGVQFSLTCGFATAKLDPPTDATAAGEGADAPNEQG